MTRPLLVLAAAVLGLTALAAPARACDCDAHRKEAATASAPGSEDPAPTAAGAEQAKTPPAATAAADAR